MGACASSVEVESEEYINTGGLNSMPLKSSLHVNGLEKGSRASTNSLLFSGEQVSLKLGSSTTKRISSESLLKKKDNKQHVLLLGMLGK